MKLLNTRTVLISFLATTILGTTVLAKTNTSELKSNKEKVVELLSSIETGDRKPVSYINKNKYIQHNLNIKDGLVGFGEALSLLPKGSAKVNVIRAFEDGKFVFTHTKYNFFGPKAGFDIFKFEDGKIVEHWDNLQTIVEKTASGRSMFDGSSEIKDLEKTKMNKQLIENLFRDVFFGKNPSKITEYISTKTYKQHNPHVKDGLKGLGEALKSLSDAGMPMVYKKNHKILGEGNFVLAVSEGLFMKEHVSFYDLFRIEDGKVVEHWDTIEEIPKKDKWQNTNGKF
jgi:predicted SnoaL-like aldol condensation-catalyzing enzyme